MTVFFACQGDALPDEHNVENIAMAAMEKAVSGQTSAFVAELDPSNFPLGDGKAFVLEDLLRIRKVDGRFLADFKLNKNGRSLEFSVWFEETASEWKVSGWDPVIHPFVATKAQQKRHTEMPSTLAAPGLRGTPSPRWAHELS